jgi:hypothetical protein
MRSFPLVVAAALASCVSPASVLRRMTPQEPFVAAAVPPAPDYSRDEAWLSLPGRPGGADAALPDAPVAATPAVDVFYVHPTTSVAARWNTPWDDAGARAGAVDGGTRIQASVFNAVGAIYAPSYRQASGVAFLRSTADGDRAIEVASADVLAAFRSFLQRTGGRRPFILAGHSQGSFLLARLLQDASLDRSRLVAAYLVGAPLRAAGLGGARACAGPRETGCVVTYNARAPGHVRNELDFEALDAVDAASAPLCVNPVLGRTGPDAAARSAHSGAVFFDAGEPARLAYFASAACDGGRLVVESGPLPWRGWMPALLTRLMGGTNAHPVEYQLFYGDLRADAARRAEAWRQQHVP